MKAVTCTNAKLEVVDRPAPAKGQLLLDKAAVRYLRIDLHARLHCDEPADAWPTWLPRLHDRNQQVVFGHEFCVSITVPNCRTWRALVVAMPLLWRGNKEVHRIAFGRRRALPCRWLVVEQSLTFSVLNAGAR